MLTCNFEKLRRLMALHEPADFALQYATRFVLAQAQCASVRCSPETATDIIEEARVHMMARGLVNGWHWDGHCRPALEVAFCGDSPMRYFGSEDFAMSEGDIAALFPEGARVETCAPIERYCFSENVPEGRRGTVICSEVGRIEVRFDRAIKGAEEWENCVILMSESGDYHEAWLSLARIPELYPEPPQPKPEPKPEPEPKPARIIDWWLQTRDGELPMVRSRKRLNTWSITDCLSWLLHNDPNGEWYDDESCYLEAETRDCIWEMMFDETDSRFEGEQ